MSGSINFIGEFLKAALVAQKVTDIEAALSALASSAGSQLAFVPVGGRENNRGVIEVATDAGRCVIERVTNAGDAILELQHTLHSGKPNCHSPREAAQVWLGVPSQGLSNMTTVQRRQLAQNVVVTLDEGEGKSSRLLSVRDHGIGLTHKEIPETILSLNASNKITKRYLAGTYGQGGSSTFSVSKYTLIASRKKGSDEVAFTIVKFLDLPADQYKTGHYVYAVLNSEVMHLNLSETGEKFDEGTLAKHFGFDLSKYSGAIDPSSVYGLLNRYLFDPIISITFQNRVHGWNRTIKGSRNALNGAVDDGDDAKGVGIAHAIPSYSVNLGDFGAIEIEYWLLEHSDTNRNPIRAYVDDKHPIILTNNGQNQGELSQRYIKKEIERPYINGRLACHINTDRLTPDAKRQLFTSTREQLRDGFVFDKIIEQVINSLKSDDELKRHNDLARERSLKSQNETNEKQIKSEVSKLLKLHGVEIGNTTTVLVKSETGSISGKPTPGGGGGGGGGGGNPSVPIQIVEPPTYVKIVADPLLPLTFYKAQRRYIRIETNANADYHDTTNPLKSRFNFVLGAQLKLVGTTPLKGGRMRIIVDCLDTAGIGETGAITVELSRTGLPVLTTTQAFAIVEEPKVEAKTMKTVVPDFNVIEVKDQQDPNWDKFPENLSPDKIASVAVQNESTLDIYYSALFPPFATEQKAFESKDPKLGEIFVARYKTWLAVHSLLYLQDKENAAELPATSPAMSDDNLEALEQQERVRIAIMSTLVAKREAKVGDALIDAE